MTRHPSGLMRMTADVERALIRSKPVVALESSVIAHGLPPEIGPDAAREAQQRVRDRGAVPATMAVIDVRTMRVADLVGERVMLAMVGHPRDDRPFDRSRAKDRKHRPHRRPRLERPVAEQAMEPNRHPETGEHVKHQKHEDVVPTQQAGPQLLTDEEQAKDRRGGHDPGDDPIAALVKDRPDIVESLGVMLGHDLTPDQRHPRGRIMNHTMYGRSSIHPRAPQIGKAEQDRIQT